MLDFVSFHGMNSKFLKKSSKGMSFAELIFSIGIVAVVLVVVVGVLTTGLDALQKGTRYNEATLVAQRLVENFKAMYYDDVPIYEPEEIFSDQGFTVKVGIIEGTYTGTLKYKKLTVDVSKMDVRSVRQKVNIKMETFFIKE